MDNYFESTILPVAEFVDTVAEVSVA